jgi:hypothetical protein
VIPSFIKIPRHICLAKNLKVKLHVFVDASTKVFAAALHAQILNQPEADDLDEASVSARGKS